MEINNENGLLHAWLKGDVDELPPLFLSELRGQWNRWLLQRYGTTGKLRQRWSAGEQPPGDNALGNGDFTRGLEGDAVPTLARERFEERTPAAQRDWLRFLWETEERYWQSLNGYLKKGLNVRALVIGTIVGCSTPNLMAQLDCVDAHAYWQHPTFPGRPWDTENWFVNNLSMVNARGGVLSELALRRVLNKPF